MQAYTSVAYQEMLDRDNFSRRVPPENKVIGHVVLVMPQSIDVVIKYGDGTAQRYGGTAPSGYRYSPRS